MERRHWFRVIGSAAAAAAASALPDAARAAASTAPIFALRNPGCSCCEGWAEHLRENGFTVHLHDSPDLQQVKTRLGIPEDLKGCHTAVVEGYRIEGHVPAELITRLLEEAPAVSGIAVPGMPIGSPGMEAMEGQTPEPYDIVAFGGVDGGERSMFGSVRP